jgi:hypothetical protein
MAAISVLAGALTPNKPPSPLTADDNQQHNIDKEQRR